MKKAPPKPAFPPIPRNGSLKALRRASRNCQACDLWQNATQTVFGEGPPRAKIMMIGEQPGNQEDLEGKPFVGPAGKLLDEALLAAGIDRKRIYLTNAVKHFKWEPRGKRRIHKKPGAKEMDACRPWLEAEIAALQPQIIVCLALRPPNPCWGAIFGSRSVAANFWIPRLRPRLWRLCIHHRSCAPPISKPATTKCSASSPISRKSPVHNPSADSAARTIRLFACCIATLADLGVFRFEIPSLIQIVHEPDLRWSPTQP